MLFSKKYIKILENKKESKLIDIANKSIFKSIKNIAKIAINTKRVKISAQLSLLIGDYITLGLISIIKDYRAIIA
jgi:hypothetical protein